MKKSRRARPITFVRATGAPIRSDEDAQIVGTELLKIAERHKVDDVRSLDKSLVYSIVEKDARHPLRRFYNWDDESAARAHRIAFTGVLIRSVRIVVRAGKVPKPVPVFIHAEAPTRRGGELRTKRTHVLRDDALRNDPVFASAVGYQIRAIINALAQLESFTSGLPRGHDVAILRSELRAAIDRYQSTLSGEKAAE